MVKLFFAHCKPKPCYDQAYGQTNDAILKHFNVKLNDSFIFCEQKMSTIVHHSHISITDLR